MYYPLMPFILYRYLAREVLSAFLLGLVIFTGVLLMGRMLKLADMVVSKGVPLADVLLLIAYLLPNFAIITIPMSLLLAVLLAFSRLSGDSEIIAIKASGISLYRILPPVLRFSSCTYLMTALTALYALPKGSTAFKELLYHVNTGTAQPEPQGTGLQYITPGTPDLHHQNSDAKRHAFRGNDSG